MATGNDEPIGRGLRAAFDLGAARERTDGQLLERFAGGRGEAAELAFAALVERHGPLVLRVARGVLADPHDAADAFQATFLVLAARARGLWARDSLGPWLRQVARRTATSQRAAAARRRRLERRAAVGVEAPRPEPADDLARVVREELDRLPERYRAPLVLCDLEGRSHEQAARALGWPVGTVKSRQARARDRLRDRLARRGVAPGLALPALRSSLDLAPPSTLIQSTTAAAARFLASRAAAPGPAAALAREVLSAMSLLRALQAASVVVALGAASGAGLIAQDRGDAPGTAPTPAPVAPPPPPDDPAAVTVRPGKFKFSLNERGVVEPARRLDLLCEIEGSTNIIRILPEGARVRAGEVVFELESATLRDRLTNQRITVLQAEAAYKRAQRAREDAELDLKDYAEGAGPRELAAVQGKIAHAEAALAKADARLARTRGARELLDARKPGGRPESPADLAADLAISDRLDAAELDIQALKLDLEAARGQQAALRASAIPRATGRLQLAAEDARANELSKQSSWDLEKLKAAKLERQIKACVVVAPADGLLVHANDPTRVAGGDQRLQIEEGAAVRERQKIASVIDVGQPMRINAKLPEAWVDQVRPGQAVRVKVEALPDESPTGVVRTIAPRPDPLAPSGGGARVYTTRFDLDRGIPNLRPGMAATVEIEVFNLDDVLTVPAGAVVRVDGRDRVAVRAADGSIELRAVTLGRSNGRAVEVKQGLQPGDRVHLNPAARPGRQRPDADRPGTG